MTNKIFEKDNLDLLSCPICNSKIVYDEIYFKCENKLCEKQFPVFNSIPCILNEENSVFTNQDFANQKDTFFKLSESGFIKTAKAIIPVLSLNVNTKTNYVNFAKYLLNENNAHKKMKVLVLGGSVIGKGMNELLSNYPSSIEFVETDVSFGPRTMLICDGHNLPFQDNSFDGVIVQAVLEHVVDPYSCVKEINRVLKMGGLVYAETPFMQQVHGRQFDFTRFSHLGHRRLFRQFEQLDSGAVCGPGMALAWSYKYFLISFSNNPAIRKGLDIFARFTAFFLKYFDYYLINKKGALDAASGYFFIGKKTGVVLSDKELLTLYKGAF
jgi:SAM-dependent methyltransferase/uncharacterized protein YbaR (Trm112 family)